jgi:hypothetical protein
MEGKEKMRKMTEKVKYIGSWSANNGSSYGGGYEFTNKKEAIKTMRDISRGNTFAGNVGRWHVTEAESLEGIAAGTTVN